MKFKRNLLILSAILIAVLILGTGCLPTPTALPAVGDVPTNGTISVAAGAATTNDTTPTLTLSSTGATHMAFSGNGTTWSAWVTYATTYSSFNVTTGEGCTSGDGTKTVYAKYKNDNGESATKVYDSIYLDTAAPKLSSAAYTDVDSSGTVNASDKITFTFNDEMLTSTVTASTVKTVLPLSSSKSYGTSPTVSWDSGLKICYVTLGTSPTLVVGTTTVNPTAAVKDTAGNADATTTAVTITGTTTTVINIAAIPGVTKPVTDATPVTKITATAQYTGIVTWSSTPTTFAASTSYTATIILTAKTGYTLTGVAANFFTVAGTTSDTNSANSSVVTAVFPATAAAAAPAASTSPDATKLSINGSAGTGNFKATYTDVPEKATVKVYSYVSNSPTDAVDADAIATITLDNTPTDCSDIEDGHYIFFKIFYSDTSISATTADGTMPSAPNPTALNAIQATSKNTFTSKAAGTVETGDKLTLYVGDTPYSDPTAVGGTTTFTLDLEANNAPKYTRTNAAGHESKPSGPDGAILALYSAVATNVDGTLYILKATDTIILKFGSSGGSDVKVTEKIYLPQISWLTSRSSKFGGNDTTALADSAASATTVTLTAFTDCVDIDTDETVTFNILPTIRIVDAAGGNRVLPTTSTITFDSDSF